ncbi:homocysteine S-methyltransferase family protein [Levilinea saccharolytica]|uniref:Methionine synthase I (Cobalamin-dependent), methyltransferase domain n=1 Tax=Levilinea saccharolytica TaxID=229921 RepID=A0A0M8JQF4_9CHLR|nr:homocysteine S-methyltransferase family protein [Levilinea saccharolytica]KPL82240.1 hypothetical protein ADN01_09040 [Levilinea saccharolytica]GAP19442.1 methionine synthase I (cobalamin-dependent), methyltransferase domain [Levilinea saccharolytica]
MPTPAFLQRLKDGKILVSDGATGTNLQQRGLPVGLPGEVWVFEKPEEILGLHRDFIAAGSDILLTCTFGGTSLRLESHGLGQRTAELNRAAVSLARQAAQGSGALVAGSIGPTGQLLKPLGPLEESQAEAAFAEQARALVEAGVDLIVVETQFDLTEASAALRAVRSVSVEIPLVCSFSFDRGKRTMMGVKPSQVAETLPALGAQVLGINCGRSLDENLEALRQLRAATDLPLWFKPNAGLPEVDAEGNPIYRLSPAEMGAQAALWLQAGAQVVGGCCGTSPAHLQAVAQAVHPAA